MSKNTEVEELVELAKVQDWKIEWTKGRHLKFIPPDPEASLVVHSGSSSDWRAIKNLRSQLKRSGLKT